MFSIGSLIGRGRREGRSAVKPRGLPDLLCPPCAADRGKPELKGLVGLFYWCPKCRVEWGEAPPERPAPPAVDPAPVPQVTEQGLKWLAAAEQVLMQGSCLPEAEWPPLGRRLLFSQVARLYRELAELHPRLQHSVFRGLVEQAESSLAVTAEALEQQRWADAAFDVELASSAVDLIRTKLALGVHRLPETGTWSIPAPAAAVATEGDGPAEQAGITAVVPQGVA